MDHRIFSFVGVKVTLIIAEVIPFLVLAVGVDNVFILIHELDRQNFMHGPNAAIPSAAGESLTSPLSVGHSHRSPFDSTQDEDEDIRSPQSPQSPSGKQPWYSRIVRNRRPQIPVSNAPPATVASISRMTMIALLIAVVLPGFGYNNGKGLVDINGADAGVVRDRQVQSSIERRASSPTDVCKRWSHQGKHKWEL